jgi:hypothetical protein
MTFILSFRESLQKLYSRYSLHVTIALKFLLGLFVFHTINDNLGFMESLDSVVIVVGLAALSSFLPPMVMVLAAILLISAHLYALSMPIMAITLLVFILLYIFYFRFVPGKTWPILIVPMAFFFDMPLVIPIIFGLLGTPLMIVPAITGTIVYHILNYIMTTETVYATEGIQEMVDDAIYFVTNIIANREQWLIAFVMGVGVLVVYAIRTRSFDHSWKAAIATGVVWLFAGLHLGSAFFGWEGPIENLAANLIMATIVGIFLEFLFFRVDYSKTEYLQFADNEYYYYVKAIPKRFSEDWMRRQDAVRRREEREKEEERQKRRTELKNRDGGDARGSSGLSDDSRRGREPRRNQEEDRPPGRRFSNFLPSHRLSRTKEGELQENLGETTVIDSEQVNSEKGRLAQSPPGDSRKSIANRASLSDKPNMKEIRGSNQTKSSSQEPRKNQTNESKKVPRSNQTNENKQVPPIKKGEEKRTDLDKSLGIEANKESNDSKKQEQDKYSGSKKKDRGGKRRDSR